jgi:hypothetical protein
VTWYIGPMMPPSDPTTLIALAVAVVVLGLIARAVSSHSAGVEET